MDMGFVNRKAQEAYNHPWFNEAPFPQDCRLMPTFPPRKINNRCYVSNKHESYSTLSGIESKKS